MGKKVMENFHWYCLALNAAEGMKPEEENVRVLPGEEHFVLYRDFVNMFRERGDEIFY